ncbi:MAG TPA: TolC family protein [Methylomirabilota bacterium]|jgi:outer membrane protein TolC|nr:TolC family protein [Methylomirabilota bacterium]
MKKLSLKSLLSAVLAGILAGAPASPVLAQDPAPAPPPKQASLQGGVPISLGLSKYHYTNSPGPWPNITAPFRTWYVNPGALTNSPRLEQLIQAGKMNLSLQDAIALALENSMDIVVQRYNPWMADTSILKTKAGGFGYGVPGSLSVGSTANLPSLIFDPYLTQSVSVNSALIAVNNPLTSGTGTNGISALGVHNSTFTTAFSQGFSTGTTLNVFWDSTRSSSTSAFNLFDPAVQSTIGISFSQQLLQGVGRDITRRNILIAENNRKIADLAFAQQAITTVTSTITAYWELVYARANVSVEEQAVKVSDKLYNDNKKQLEIGTMAPLDVTRAESELATDRQNLIVAQTTQLQDELVLKNFISKDPTASNLIDVEIIPTDKPDAPQSIQLAPFADAVKEAFVKRPDVQEQILNVKNGEIDVKATKNALLPQATLTGTYSSTGLAGNSLATASGFVAGPQVVDANGNPVTVLNSTSVPTPIFVPTATTTVTGVNKTGLSDSLSQVFHNRFPSYTVGINFTLPLRNRSAQADSVHAQLTERQLEAQMQQIKNSAVLDVRNTSIALEQGRAQVEAASKARELQQQTFDAEQKKYQLGASTVYNVILTQRDLITAQGTELRALANLAEAKANYERALGRTLEVNSVTIAGAKKGDIEPDTLIPGTRDGQVVGTEELFKALDDKGKSGNR